MGKKTWETCKYSFPSKRKSCVGEPVRKYGFHDAYYCRNSEILALDVYPTNASGEKAEFFDVFELHFGREEDLKTIRNMINKALAGCTHCEYYEKK